MKFTGERYVPTEQGRIRIEHYHRYMVAQQVIVGIDVLDVACGEGYGSSLIAQQARSVVGLDIEEAAIRHARSTYASENLTFRKGSATDLPFEDASFDAVVSFETIEHLAEQARMLEEIRRVLRPTGFLIISSPNRPVYSEESGEHNEYHVKELDFKELDNLLKAQFPLVRYFGQRLLMGSVIQNLDEGAAFFRAWHDDGQQVKPDAGRLTDPVYFLAVCGDGSISLPELDPSVLYPSKLDLIKHYVGFATWAQSLDLVVAKREEQIAALGESLRKRDQDLDQVNRRLVERDEQVEKLSDAVRGRDAQLADAKQLYIEADRQLNEIRDELNARDKQISELEREIRGRDARIANLGGEASELERQLTSQYHALQEKARAIAEALARRDAEVSVIYRSWSWRLSRPVRGGGRILRASRNALISHTQTMWHRVPLPGQARYRVKSALFRLAGPLFRGTSVYTAWIEQSRWAEQSLNSALGQGYTAQPVVGDRRIAGGDSSKPRVSVIVPVFNNIDYTLACLDSIAREIPQVPIEVLVVDDCSKDETERLLSKREDIRYFRNKKNLGFVGSCNRGAEAARGEYIFFLNNDTVVLSGWLDHALQTFLDRPGVGLVGSKLIYPDGRLQEAGGLIWADASGWNWGRLGDPAAPEFNFSRDVDYCSGAAFLIRKELFDELGGFDQRFAPGYYEDTDLAFMIRERGLRVIYQPLSVVVHYEGVSAGTDLSSGMKAYQIRNRELFREKWAHVLIHHGDPDVRPPRFSADRNATARMLVIDACTPTPDQDAGSVSFMHYMRLFDRLGYRVTFIPESNLLHYGSYTEALQAMGVECLYHPFIQSVAQVLEARGDEFDAIMMVRGPEAHRYLNTVRSLCPRAKLILNTVDLHYLREQRRFNLEPGKSQAEVALRTKAIELAVIEQCDSTIVLSSVEKEVLAVDAPQAHVKVIPLLVSVPGRTRRYEDRAGIVFVGGFRHPPNVDGILWFCREVWPLVRKQAPSMTLDIVGSNLIPEIQALKGDGVRVLGFVEDLVPVFSKVRLSVAPLRYGAGQKGKVITSLGYGVPCIVTSVAAEGLDLNDSEGVLRADDAVAYAESLLRAYDDPLLWEKLSQSGLRAADRIFSPEANLAKLQELLRDLGLPWSDTQAVH